MAGERNAVTIVVDTDHNDDDQNIDALLTGDKWDTSISNVITFSFTDSAADYSYSAGTGVTFASAFDATQQQGAREALAEFAAVADVVFSELAFGSADGTLRFAEVNGINTAFGYYPNDFESGGDMAFNPNDYNVPTLGTFAYHTYLHEIGHAMGLKHGHDNTASSGYPDVGEMTADRDGMEWSVMTYNSFVGQNESPGFYTNVAGHYAQTLMVYDIAALHRLYGANYDTNNTASTYTFNTSTGEMSINGVGQGTPAAAVTFRTVWDGGGVDTYDLSNFTTNLALDLRPGEYSDFDTGGNLLRAQLNAGWDSSGTFVFDDSEHEFANGHLWNALLSEGNLASLIENAVGGTGDDIIVGNKGTNTLTGGRGIDELQGQAGDDVLYGGGGFDLIFGGGDDDHLIGGGGEDELQGDDGADSLFGGGGADTLYGQAGSDTLEGGDSGDRLVGGNGADLLVGGEGADTLSGGKGADELRGGKGADVLEGGDQGDILKGQKGNDTLKGQSGADRLEGGEGNDRLTGGTGADVFVYNGNANEGTDRITDFDNGTDKIEISGATTFGDLTIAVVNGNTQVTWDLNKIIIEGITSGIGSNDFDFV